MHLGRSKFKVDSSSTCEQGTIGFDFNFDRLYEKMAQVSEANFVETLHQRNGNYFEHSSKNFSMMFSL